MDRIAIKNGMVYDGTGKAGQRIDLLICGDVVEKMGSFTDAADRVIDAEGMVVCPGFVDIHRHCDQMPFCSEAFGETELLQGITTTVVGNCGISLTPTSAAHQQVFYDFAEPVLGVASEKKLLHYADYMAELDKARLPMNFASMVGTGSMRIALKGFSDSPYTEQERKQTQRMVESALLQGAAGISLGIMYLPECYSSLGDYGEILQPAGKLGAVVTAHIRGEGDSLVQSVGEVIEIGRLAGCGVHISHFKSCGMKNWNKKIHQAIALIEQAREDGQDVTCDFYPYEGGSTTLVTMIPPEFVGGQMEDALKRLGTPQGVEQFRLACRKEYDSWDNFAITVGWDRILISGVTKAHNQRYIGLDIETAAEEFGFADAEAFAAQLLYDEMGKVAIINMSMCYEDIHTIAKLDYCNVISDAIYADTKTPHPRLYGAFPKIIREFVGEKGLFTLEQAIYKMTGQPARRMKLDGRGVLAPGSFADLLVFDPKKFRDNATFTDSAQHATGLTLCMVNGVVAVEHGRVLNRAAGKNLRIRHVI